MSSSIPTALCLLFKYCIIKINHLLGSIHRTFFASCIMLPILCKSIVTCQCGRKENSIEPHITHGSKHRVHSSLCGLRCFVPTQIHIWAVGQVSEVPNGEHLKKVTTLKSSKSFGGVWRPFQDTAKNHHTVRNIVAEKIAIWGYTLPQLAPRPATQGFHHAINFLAELPNFHLARPGRWGTTPWIHTLSHNHTT